MQTQWCIINHCFCTSCVNLLVNSPCPVSPPEKKGPDTPSASPPLQSSSWGWAATDHRTHQTCWSSGSTQSNEASSAAGPRTGLSQERRGWQRQETFSGRPHWTYILDDTHGWLPLDCSPHLLFCCHLSLSASSTWQLPPLRVYRRMRNEGNRENKMWSQYGHLSLKDGIFST